MLGHDTQQGIWAWTDSGAEPSPERFQQEGFTFVQGGLTFLNLIKTPPIYNAS